MVVVEILSGGGAQSTPQTLHSEKIVTFVNAPVSPLSVNPFSREAQFRRVQHFDRPRSNVMCTEVSVARTQTRQTRTLARRGFYY